MHGAILVDMVDPRRADLLREAAQARRVAAARRNGSISRTTWRRRVGALLIGLGEAIAGCPPRVEYTQIKG